MFFLAWVFAATAAGGPQRTPQAPQNTGGRPVAAVIAPAESAVVGTIERFEEEARRLVLQTKDSHIPFILAPDVVVRLGSHTLPVSDLSAHRGRKAKVRYTQSEGHRTAHWVVISSDPPHKTP